MVEVLMAAAMDQRDGVTAVTATRYPLAAGKKKEEGPARGRAQRGRWACAVTPSRPSFAALRSSAPLFAPGVPRALVVAA